MNMLESATTQCSTAAAECDAMLRSSCAPRLQNGRTPLITASVYGHAETVKALIEGRADLEAKCNVRMDGARARRGGLFSALISTCACARECICTNVSVHCSMQHQDCPESVPHFRATAVEKVRCT
jgi:hypothetical protein